MSQRDLTCYPTVPLAEWCEKHGLEVVTDRCCGCRRKVSTTIPFADKRGPGLTTPTCICGLHNSVSIQSLKPGVFENIIALARAKGET